VGEALDPVAAAGDLVRLGQRGQSGQEVARALGRDGGDRRRHFQGGRQRIRRQLVDHAGVFAEHLLQRAQRVGLADEHRARNPGHRADAVEQRRDVAGRRLTLEIDDDAHLVAPLRDGAADV
jgi:hypothetical protein